MQKVGPFRVKKIKTYAEKANFLLLNFSRGDKLFTHIRGFDLLSRSKCGTKLVLLATENTFLKINIVRKIYPKL